MPGEFDAVEKKRPHFLWRHRKAAAVTVVVALLLFGIVGEILARLLVPKLAAQAIRQELKLQPNQTVAVTTSGFVLPQVLAGRLRDVTVQVPDYRVAESLVGSVTARIGGVALDPGSAPLADTTVEMKMSDAQFYSFVSSFAPDYIDNALARNNSVEFEKTFEVFGQRTGVRAFVQLGAADGQLTVTPLTFTAGGITVDADSLQRLVGGRIADLAEKFGAVNSFCIADRIPRGVQLESVSSERGSVTVTLRVDPRFTVDKNLAQLGSCP